MQRDPNSKLKVAASADLHCRESDHGRFRQFVRQVNDTADLLVLCGDLTDRGLTVEAKTLAEELSALRVPCAAVLGNHDLEHDQAKEVREELVKVGVKVLDGDYFIFEKVLGIAGVKGFAGGFGRTMLQAFGEAPIKAFVQEGVNEALKLESVLSRLETERRIVIMHYAPIPATLQGEPIEIFPYMGTSRLALAIDEFGASAVFHGHAHHGTLEGKTDKGVPVYNVAMPLLQRHTDQRFRIVEV